ncbi:MAG: diguanylate cyclase [Gammaproteobacteria bacterium]|nr:MAG: diguanylate cyclase [Gammaproteobacteria bacterium]
MNGWHVATLGCDMQAEQMNAGPLTPPADALTPELARQVIEALHTPVLVLGPAAAAERPLCWNPAFLRLTGFDAEAFTAAPQAWLSRPEALFAALRATDATEGQALVVDGQDALGQPVRWRLRVTPLVGEGGEAPSGWLLECARAEGVAARQRGLLRDDAVSGMLDRGWFVEFCRHQVSGARRHDRQLALMVFEVEAFDVYVETYGRNAANNCLRLVAHGIASCLRRTTDLVARVGDSTFAALAEDMTAEAVAAHLARIEAAVAALGIHNPRAPGARHVQVTGGARAGVPAAGEDIEDWLAAARQAAAAGDQRVVAAPDVGRSTG